MTDLEKFKEMIIRAGLTYEVDVTDTQVSLSFYAGYIGFVSVMSFDLETGNLLTIEAYE